jgi:hypothetical protein
VDPVPDPLLRRKSGSVENRTRDLWVSSQQLTTRSQRRFISPLQNKPVVLFREPIAHYCEDHVKHGTCGNIVDWGTILQAWRSLVRFLLKPLNFFIGLIFPIALWPWGSLSHWQIWVPGIFMRVKSGRHVMQTSSPCGNLDVSQFYGPPRPVSEIIFIGYSKRKKKLCNFHITTLIQN